MLLLVYGVAAFVGNLLSGPVSDRSMRAAVILFPVLIGTGTVIFATTGGAYVATIIAAAVWGLGFGGVPTAVQTWMARVAPDHLEAAVGWSSPRSRWRSPSARPWAASSWMPRTCTSPWWRAGRRPSSVASCSVWSVAAQPDAVAFRGGDRVGVFVPRRGRSGHRSLG